MSRRKAMFFNQQNVINEPNVFMGGVSSVLTSASDVASSLTIDASDIENFEIIGNDIAFYIGRNYKINVYGFGVTVIGNVLTYYFDLSSNNVVASNFAFYQQSNVEIISITSNFTIEGYSTFRQLSNAPYINLTNITGSYIGGSSGNDLNFAGTTATQNAYLIAPSYYETNNGGAVDEDIQIAIDYGLNATFISDTTPPSAISNLTITNVTSSSFQTNFTVPSSTNTILFYEVWNSKKQFLGLVFNTGDVINGLTSSTQYSVTLITIDIYGNRSANSNEIIKTTP